MEPIINPNLLVDGEDTTVCVSEEAKPEENSEITIKEEPCDGTELLDVVDYEVSIKKENIYQEVRVKEENPGASSSEENQKLNHLNTNKRSLPDWMTKLSNNSSTPAKKIKAEDTPEATSAAGSSHTNGSQGGDLESSDKETNDEKDGFEKEYGDSSTTAVNTDAEDPTAVDPAAVTSNQGTSLTRQPCMYGQSCYRRNLQHRTDFSHPSDADWNSSSSTDLPECQYGTSCYRKNVLHRTQFKHTQYIPPQAPRATSNVFNSGSVVYVCCPRCRCHKPKDSDDDDDDDDEP